MGGCPTTSNKVSCQNCKYSLIETLKQKYDLLVNSDSGFNNQNLDIALDTNNERAAVLFLVKPINAHTITMSTETDCPNYNSSCGTPKLWWNLQL